MKQKLRIFFRRVSSANQDLTTQIEFDRIYREQCDKEHIVEVNENDTSANKLSIAQRPEMMKIIQLIKEGRVEKLYAYDRTRLFRDYYEAQAFYHTCIEHNVEIIFTSSSNGHIGFTGDIFMEGLLNLFGDIEGKNIARRTREARRKYPSRKFGYIKTEQKTYQKAPEIESALVQFFEEIQQIRSLDLFTPFLNKYRKMLAKTDDYLIRLATDPFYAGYDLYEGEYTLPHVDPFITKETFLQIQGQLNPLIKAYETNINKLLELYIGFPKCGYCLKPLKPRFNSDRSLVYFSCSKGHSKIYYDTFTINKTVVEVIEQIIAKLNVNQLLMDSTNSLKEIRKMIKQAQGETEMLIKETEDTILFSQEGYDKEWNKQDIYQEVLSLQQQYRLYEEELDKKQQLLIENKQLHQLTVNAIENQVALNVKALCDLLINDVRLYEQSIEFDINKCDYILNLDDEIILNPKENIS
ncbi:recombinase family protein [Priestia aryabhattai]|uniref:recombinase family protein n=1 Tax=Priestia aryabhattai TaxID=412384 RepID=UPI003D299966